MVAVIDVDAYPFLFSGCTVSPDSKETKLGNSDTKWLLHQQIKIP